MKQSTSCLRQLPPDTKYIAIEKILIHRRIKNVCQHRHDRLFFCINHFHFREIVRIFSLSRKSTNSSFSRKFSRFCQNITFFCAAARICSCFTYIFTKTLATRTFLRKFKTKIFIAILNKTYSFSSCISIWRFAMKQNTSLITLLLHVLNKLRLGKYRQALEIKRIQILCRHTQDWLFVYIN